MATGDRICEHCGMYNGNHANNCPISINQHIRRECLPYADLLDRPLHIISVDDSQKFTITKIGWECPVCHRGLSPDVTVCEHDGNVLIDKDNVVQLSGSPINFDSWKDLEWYDDED